MLLENYENNICVERVIKTESNAIMVRLHAK